MTGRVSAADLALAQSGRLARVLDRWVGNGRIAGGVLLLAEGGALTGEAVAGWADREARRPVVRGTMFRLASMTKLVVSVAALRLCEEGRLGLESPVADWLPDFRPALPDGTRPTILLRHLMSHTAGLGYGFELPPGNGYETNGVSDGLDHVCITLDENLRRLAAQPLLARPGTEWRYSLATDVLGRVVERAAGVPLAEAVDLWVTMPLGMKDTAFRPPPGADLAAPYWDGVPGARRMAGTGWYPVDAGRARISAERVYAPDAYESGGAGMVGTADDYMRLLLCLRAGGYPILRRDTVRALVSGAIGDLPIANRGPGWTFGLGPVILSDPAAAGSRQGRGTWGWCGVHGGHYWVDPETDRVLVALTNTGTAGAWGPFADELVEAVYA